MSIIAITDYFSSPVEEAEVLGDLVGMSVDEDTEVLIVWHKHINEEYVSKLPKLRGVQRYGVGYDTLDIPYLKSRGIVACNNPDYGTDEVADTAVGMILNIARGITVYDRNAKSYYKTWQENINPLIKRNSDITIGIIGAGRIGGNVLMKCNALKFKTVFYDPYKERGYEKMINGKRLESLKELLNVSDIVSIHAPLTPETRGIINVDFVNCMRFGASIVNTARGAFFQNLDLLYDALKDSRVYCLATDVLEYEPPQSNKLIDSWRKDERWLQGRVIINPHTSYYSQAAYRELRLNAAKNALKIYTGERPFNLLW